MGNNYRLPVWRFAGCTDNDQALSLVVGGLYCSFIYNAC